MTFMRKGKDPDPYLWLTDPDKDPGSPKNIRILWIRRTPQKRPFCNSWPNSWCRRSQRQRKHQDRRRPRHRRRLLRRRRLRPPRPRCQPRWSPPLPAARPQSTVAIFIFHPSAWRLKYQASIIHHTFKKEVILFPDSRTRHLYLVLRIRIRAKMTHKRRKKIQKFHVFKCWTFSFEIWRLLFNLYVLYGGLKIGEL